MVILYAKEMLKSDGKKTPTTEEKNQNRTTYQNLSRVQDWKLCYWQW